MARPSMGAAVLATLSATALAMAPPVAAADLAGAKAFVQDLYAGYRKDVAGPELQSARFLDRPLLDLWDKSDKGADGIVVEADPVCACQDFDITNVDVAIEPAGPDNAKATVSFKNFGERVTVRFDLVETTAGWRIADIHDTAPHMTSLRKLLEDAVAAQTRR